jgi:hypothetical protein
MIATVKVCLLKLTLLGTENNLALRQANPLHRRFNPDIGTATKAKAAEEANIPTVDGLLNQTRRFYEDVVASHEEQLSRSLATSHAQLLALTEEKYSIIAERDATISQIGVEIEVLKSELAEETAGLEARETIISQLHFRIGTLQDANVVERLRREIQLLKEQDTSHNNTISQLQLKVNGYPREFSNRDAVITRISKELEETKTKTTALQASDDVSTNRSQPSPIVAIVTQGPVEISTPKVVSAPTNIIVEDIPYKMIPLGRPNAGYYRQEGGRIVSHASKIYRESTFLLPLVLHVSGDLTGEAVRISNRDYDRYDDNGKEKLVSKPSAYSRIKQEGQLYAKWVTLREIEVEVDF